MRFLRALVMASLALLAAACLFVFLTLSASIPPFDSAEPSRQESGRAVGVLHVHSRYSDGAGSVSEILQAAAESGLDFVVLTDHGDADALGMEGEGYTEGVLLLVGSEISTEGGHLLALDLPDVVFRFGTNTGEVLRDVVDLGGFAIAAHPNASRPSFAWEEWELPGLAGIELFNFFSGWRRQGVASIGRALLLHPFSPRRALSAALEWDSLLVEKWDDALTERNLAAWVGLDAHGQLSFSEGVQLPWGDYREVFQMARNHLVLEEPLSGDVARDRQAIYRALEEGRGYLSLDGIADGSGFRFYAQAASRRWPMGSRVPARLTDTKLRLVASIRGPRGTRLRILRDGVLMKEVDEGPISLAVDEPGVYRAEARLDSTFVPGGRDQPWILSNPIFILAKEELDDRLALKESFPSPATADGMACRAVGEAPWPVAFHAEHDAASRMDEGLAESSQGRFTIDFELSQPSAERPYVWCAVADRTSRDLSDFGAVRFRVRGDRIYRVTFQIRDVRPEAPEGTEWWAASFKTAPEWQEVVIPFDRLRSISESSDGRLDLDRTRGLFFVLDAGNTRPGVSGTIEVRDLELCAPASRSSR